MRLPVHSCKPGHLSKALFWSRLLRDLALLDLASELQFYFFIPHNWHLVHFFRCCHSCQLLNIRYKCLGLKEYVIPTLIFVCGKYFIYIRIFFPGLDLLHPEWQPTLMTVYCQKPLACLTWLWPMLYAFFPPKDHPCSERMLEWLWVTCKGMKLPKLRTGVSFYLG